MNNSARIYYMNEFGLGGQGLAPHKHINWDEALSSNIHLDNASYPVCMEEQ